MFNGCNSAPLLSAASLAVMLKMILLVLIRTF